MLVKIKALLSGKKSYIVAALLVILSGLHAQGYITVEEYQLILGILGGLGLAALRAGISK